ncbi:MAG: polysaccharide deacetylase family protein [Magnetococcales bacterium]|nr:polysaccharide deacetylase family protein [Magnetococcales bacterium]
MLRPFHLKRLLAALLAATGLPAVLIARQGRQPAFRIVNLHDVPPRLAGAFETQVRLLGRHFEPSNPAALQRFIRKDPPPPVGKPHLLFTFDDGLRSGHEVVAPLLEQHGCRGIFFVPAAVLELPAERQADWARDHRIFPGDPPEPGQRLFLDIAQCRDLMDRGHAIGCHGLTHVRLTADLGSQRLREETIGARERMETLLDRPVTTFAWIGGEIRSYCREAALLIERANFQEVFLTNHALITPATKPRLLDRSHLEADFSPALTLFQVCGLMDLLYRRKRLAVHRLAG